MSTVRREARTTPLPEQERAPGPHLEVVPPAPATENDDILQKLREAGLPIPDSTEPLGQVTLQDGTKLTLRDLDGEDETLVEVFMDSYGVKSDGAGQATSLRFNALMSIHTIQKPGEPEPHEQAPIRHIEQLRRLLKYKRIDQGRIVAAYLRFSLAGDGSPFRPQG